MIVSVTGSADNWDIIFSRNAGDAEVWTATVPPDTEDGAYYCVITATEDTGATGTWAGVLYIADGRFVRLELMDERADGVKLRDGFTSRELVGRWEETAERDGAEEHVEADECRCMLIKERVLCRARAI